MRLSWPLPAILVVDDTPSIHEPLTQALQSLVPYEVIAVTDTAAAVSVLATRPVPLVITGYHLAAMRGDELAKAIKGASPATSVLVITDMSNLTPKQGGRILFCRADSIRIRTGRRCRSNCSTCRRIASKCLPTRAATPSNSTSQAAVAAVVKMAMQRRSTATAVRLARHALAYRASSSSRTSASRVVSCARARIRSICSAVRSLSRFARRRSAWLWTPCVCAGC